MNCRVARNVIVELVRDGASEADRLRLEQHLGACASCREDRAQWSLLERLRDQPTRRLGPQARARVLDRLLEDGRQRREQIADRAATTSATSVVSSSQDSQNSEHSQDSAASLGAGVSRISAARVTRVARSHWRSLALSTFAAAAVLALMLRGANDPTHGSSGSAGTVVVAVGQTVRAERAGAVRLAGAQLWYPAGAALRLSSARRIDLVAGEVEVEVTPGGPGRFRVYTPRFIVEVLGTRFVVRHDGMRTLHGTVRVLDRSERQLALVRGGEVWQAPADLLAVAEPTELRVGASGAVRTGAAVQQFNPSAGIAPQQNGQAAIAGAAMNNDSAATTSAGIPVAMQQAATNAPSVVPVAAMQHALADVEASGSEHRAGDRADRLLADAYSALLQNRTDIARARILAALDAAPTDRQQALADLYKADSLRIDRSYDQAIRAYRLTAYRWPGFPEGEQASFFVAQMLTERGTKTDAREAIGAYLQRYPSGRFIAEAQKSLAELSVAHP